MKKGSPNNENETKLDIFPWETFKSDAIFCLSKDIEVFQ